MVNAYKVRFITGDLDINKDWDVYIDTLNNNGLSDYMKFLQTVYDRRN